MIRPLPIIPTILVVAAAATMVWLGFWQLGRADEKAAMIAEFEAKAGLPEIVDIEAGASDLVYRQVRFKCESPSDWQAISGRNAAGRSGFAHRYWCTFSPLGFDTSEPLIVTYADIGWSVSPAEPNFEGGTVKGTLVALGDDFKVVASEPLAGLQPLAKPDPGDLPNNHLAYAGQWFFFALTALVIYFFAVRSRLARRD